MLELVECGSPILERVECGSPMLERVECCLLMLERVECRLPMLERVACGLPMLERVECGSPMLERQECSLPMLERVECWSPMLERVRSAAVGVTPSQGQLCVCVYIHLQFQSKQGAIPLVIGGCPTKTPMTRAENVPARANEDIKKFEEMQQDETVSTNRLEKQMVGHDCRNTCYLMLGFGQSRVKSSMCEGCCVAVYVHFALADVST